ncbi:hypothetical protein DY000_02059895 [Brassica cretica]|uniref:Uncharacterized protein n=1 Tax=Brassica cretica TaxID=69181 RepID=A0ABQ7APV0_BRACR|nr:hypothetical protein DY000_02059895 [Brassica cretica]
MRIQTRTQRTGHYVASKGLTGRYVASGTKPRRVLLVFVVKSQRKLRLRRNETRFDENSNENAKEDLSEALQRPSLVRAQSLRSDRAWLELYRYVATELCNRFAALPFSAINLGVFCGFWENKFYLPKSFRKTCFEKSQARFVALPVGEKSRLGRYVASEGLTGRYVVSGSKPRRVLLVFVVKSQRKLRLRRNEKHFDEDSKKNAKEDLPQALQVAT